MMQAPKKGLTLIEIIVAVMIMAFGIVPIMRFGPDIFRAREGSQEVTQATFLATRVIEETRGRVFNDYFHTYSTLEDTNFEEPFEEYVYSISDDADGVFRTLHVSVWHQDNEDNPVELYTKIAWRTGMEYVPTDRVANMTLRKSYHYIQNALDDPDIKGSSVQEHDIRAQADAVGGVFEETITALHTEHGLRVLRVSGGWNEDFSVSDSYSTIRGSLTHDTGNHYFKNFVIEE